LSASVSNGSLLVTVIRGLLAKKLACFVGSMVGLVKNAFECRFRHDLFVPVRELYHRFYLIFMLQISRNNNRHLKRSKSKWPNGRSDGFTTPPGDRWSKQPFPANGLVCQLMVTPLWACLALQGVFANFCCDI
jgi:hypothetical protein